jgi:hypothetical protein
MSEDHISPGDDIKTLLEFYKDNVAYQRHHEEIRFKSSQLIVTLAAALIAAFKFTSNSATANFAISIFVILLGFLGIAQVIKHTERADRHAMIARAYRKRVDKVSSEVGGSSIEEIHDSAAAIHKNRAGMSYSLRARWLWLAMHAAIVVVGVTLSVLSYYHMI